MTTHSPFRHPQALTPDQRVHRAWWLLVGNLILPGTAQVVAGSRRFGRFMLGMWLTVWAVLLVVGLLALLWRAPLLFLATTNAFILALWVVVLFVCLCCVLSHLDALRLTRLVSLDRLAAPLVGIVGFAIAFVPFIAAATTSQVALQVNDTVHTLFGGPSAGVKLPADGRYNIMLLGADRGSDREGLRPDSISVMSFDAITGKATVIGLPRAMESFPFAPGPMHDAYPNGYEDCLVDTCYLNAVYTEATQSWADKYPDAKAHGSEPGIEATKEAVEGITGLDIQYFALIDMAGFANLVDALGGVTIDVKERVGIGINDDGSPGWQPATQFIEPGLQHMDGSTALWYARSRYETTDFARMQRQRDLQAAIIAAATPANLASRIGPVTDAVEKLVETDMPEGIAGIVADLLVKSRSAGTVQLELVPPNFDQGNPDIPRIHAAVKASFSQEPAGATSTPSPTG